jgi:hypothetical protein
MYKSRVYVLLLKQFWWLTLIVVNLAAEYNADLTTNFINEE